MGLDRRCGMKKKTVPRVREIKKIVHEKFIGEKLEQKKRRIFCLQAEKIGSRRLKTIKSEYFVRFMLFIRQLVHNTW